MFGIPDSEMIEDQGNMYAVLEKDTNKLLGWYNDEIHSIIPEPNIQVTKKVWQDALGVGANFYNSITKKFEKKDFRSEAEVASDELIALKNKYDRYLKDTDWVEPYLIKHMLGIEIISEDSSKWEIINRRKEYRQYLKEIQ